MPCARLLGYRLLGMDMKITHVTEQDERDRAARELAALERIAETIERALVSLEAIAASLQSIEQKRTP